MIHRIQLRRGAWQQANFDAQFLCHLLTLFGSMWGSAILKQHDMLASPVSTEHLQKELVRDFIPYFGDQQHHIAALDVDRSVQNSFAAIARDRHAGLLTDPAVATIQRRRFTNDGLIKHHDNGSRLRKKPPF